MKALICRALSDDIGTVRVEDFPSPEPGAGEVKVKVHAACVNFPDVLMIKGLYQHKPPLPFICGTEAAGVITAFGPGVTTHVVGERVIASGIGAFADERVLPAEMLRAIPAGLDFAHAAAFGGVYLTAYVALVRRAALQAGETLLVHGAAGGTGLAAADLGKHLGATIIAVASTEKKRELLRARGADHVIAPQNFKDAVKDITGGRGADVIFDPVGGDVFDESVRCIAWGGRLLVIGFTSGRIASISSNMPLIKGFSVVGVRAGEYGRRDPVRGAENMAVISGLAAEGAIHPYIGARFPLARAVDAMRMLEQREAIGKVVIEMGSG